MKHALTSLPRSKVPPPVQAVLEGLHSRLGHVPRFFTTVAHSAPALRGYLDFTTTLRTGALDGAEMEVAYLAASQAHECADGLAAHTAAGQLYGLPEAELLAARTASSSDARLRAVAALARALVLTQGHPDATLLRQFFAAGYSKAALVELVGLVAANTFHSYVMHLTTAPLPEPAAASQ